MSRPAGRFSKCWPGGRTSPGRVRSRSDCSAAFTGSRCKVGRPRLPLTFRPAAATVMPTQLGRGCDRAPLDPTSEADQTTLLSYLWPDQDERFQRMRAAFAVAEQVPASVDEADAIEWVREQLAASAPGATTVVYHSIFIQYLA